MKYQLLPPLTEDEQAALAESIRTNGVLVPVEYDENGDILDGHHRIAVCKRLGIADWPRVVRSGLSEQDKRAHVRALNLARRHLTTFQKRALIEAHLIDVPHLSNRAIGEALGVDGHTVAASRERLRAAGKLSPVSRVVGRNGSSHPASRPKLPESPLLSDGVRLAGLTFWEIGRRIADCEHDLALLKAVAAHAVPTDDRQKVGDAIAAPVLRKFAERVQ